ncbi:hypothetical protein DN062_02630 [Nitrincola tibetensis]|uniref:Methyltransferase FkbM domain-containing protein n=1 Tax=Nitrincola tibetensis TaxID=2219697 RepID=A0A364NQ76_9GAMM|nr:FkbM family methyltransferase [Nitrincola tibetensis]RAU19182.1 hypothetical protein DN062_02630 [Nitrincola tibetensis]
MECFLWTDASKARNQLSEKYEPLQPFLFLSFLEFSGAEIVLDVGANVGLYSLVATLAVKVSSVYSFEPDEAAYQELNQNLTLNCVEKLCKPFQLAISDSTGSVHFGRHSPMSGVNGVVNTSIHDASIFSETYDVEAVTLDQLDDMQGKVLGIKIDVEGHELQVIDGASKLLSQSPAFIQIEHYTGSGIDEKLKNLGYFCFFTAGHDHYFTNVSNFRNPLFVKRAIEHASTWFIETHAGRWPDVNTIKNSLSVTYDLSADKANIECVLRDGFFSEPEYAFYLMVNNEKLHQQWYQIEPKATFILPEIADSIEIKCFVREKQFPEKKVMESCFIKHKTSGYRAESAVGESIGMPSQYAVVSRLFGRPCVDDFDINLSPLLHAINIQNIENIIQLGAGITALALARKFKQMNAGCLSVLCTEEGALALKQGHYFKDEVFNDYSQRISLHRVSNVHNFEKTLASLVQRIDSVSHVILRGQFLADIGISVVELMRLLAHFPKGCKLYTEGLVNASYRRELTDLAAKHDITVEWLYPRSTIIPIEELSLEDCQYATNNISVVKDMSHATVVDLSFSVPNSPSFERALGLDFSLFEDRG